MEQFGITQMVTNKNKGQADHDKLSVSVLPFAINGLSEKTLVQCDAKSSSIFCT